jgi:preprotein translocase subunit Sss1
MHQADKRHIKQRARKIRKANKPKPKAEDYLQIVMVVLLIALILGFAFWFTYR